MAKIVIGLVVVIAALALAQQQRVFEEWGVTGSCAPVRAPSGDGGVWYRCSEGLLTGYPSLLGDQCAYQLRAKGYEYWRCPTRLSRFARQA